MNYAQRMAAARQHEQRVADALVRRGWHVDMVGQSQLSDEAHDALRAIEPECLMRWWPDMLAVKRASGIWLHALVDAKAGGGAEYENHIIEESSVRAANVFAEAFRLPIYYVFSDSTVVSCSEVNDHAIAGHYRGNGSGTPFLMFPKALARSFNSIFGEPIEREEVG